MRVEAPKIVQQIGRGTVSSIAVHEVTNGFGLDAGATLTGALCSFAAGTFRSGCVLVILTAAAGAAAGSGKMLIRAVSFFGPVCPPEPG